MPHASLQGMLGLGAQRAGRLFRRGGVRSGHLHPYPGSGGQRRALCCERGRRHRKERADRGAPPCFRKILLGEKLEVYQDAGGPSPDECLQAMGDFRGVRHHDAATTAVLGYHAFRLHHLHALSARLLHAAESPHPAAVPAVHQDDNGGHGGRAVPRRERAAGHLHAGYAALRAAGIRPRREPGLQARRIHVVAQQRNSGERDTAVVLRHPQACTRQPPQGAGAGD